MYNGLTRWTFLKPTKYEKNTGLDFVAKSRKFKLVLEISPIDLTIMEFGNQVYVVKSSLF